MDPILKQGEDTSEFKMSRNIVILGLGIQTIVEGFNHYQHSVHDPSQMVAMLINKEATPTDIANAAEVLKGQGSDSYTGALLALIMAIVYVVKRAVLKYYELKAQIEIQVAQIQADAQKEIERIKSGQSNTPVVSNVHTDSKDSISFT